MKKKGTAIAAAVLVLLCVLAGILYFKFKQETTEGSKEITVEVVNADGESEVFHYRTEAEYLVEVLEENNLVEGTKGEYGLYITSVNGVKADDSKQQWWCITKAGEQVNTSADQTPVQDKDKFELTLKEGY